MSRIPYHKEIRKGLNGISVSRLACTADQPISISIGRHNSGWMSEAEAVSAAFALLAAVGQEVVTRTLNNDLRLLEKMELWKRFATESAE